MSVRGRILLPLLAALLTLTGASAVLIHRVAVQNTAQVEARQVELDRQRLASAIHTELKDLQRQAQSWAWSDDLVAFMDLPEQSFVERQFSAPRLASAGIQALMVVRGDDSQLVGLQWSGVVLSPPTVSFSGDAGAQLWLHHNAQADSVKGLWREPNGKIWLVVAEQIRNSQASEFGVGTLIVGRQLGPEILQSLRDRTLMSLQLSPQMPESPERVMVTGNTLWAWTVLPTLNGGSVALEMREDRLPRRPMVALEAGAVGIVAASGLILALLIATLLEGGVVQPLRRADARVRAAAGNIPLGHPLEDEVATVVADLSELLTASHAARQEHTLEHRRLLLLLDSVPMAVGIKDRSRIYQTVNRRFAELVERSPLGVEGRRDEDVFPAEIAPEMRAEDEAVMLSGANAAPRELPLRIRAVNRQFLLHKVPLREGGEVVGLIVVLQDVTEVRREQAEGRARSRFLVGLSAQLREPVADLVQRLGRPGAPPPLREAESLARRLEDLLVLSRLDDGSLELSSAQLPFMDLLRGVMAELQPLAEARNVRLELGLGLRTPVEVVGDVVHLRQMFSGILHTALEHSRAGGRLELGVDADEEPLHPVWVHVSLRDSGPLYSTELRARLLDPFAEGERPGGVGLALAARLVRRMGGELKMEAVNNANLIRLSIPFTARMMPRRAQRVLRVLVVDNNPLNRKVVARLLERVGHTVLTAGNATDALEAATVDTPDVMLLEMKLPDVDGPSVVRLMRAKGFKMLVVGLTADPTDRDPNVDRVLLKPISAQPLYELLDDVVLARARLAPETLPG